MATASRGSEVSSGLPSSLYEMPDLYDVVACGPCEQFYIEKLAKVAGPVLELGCGSGRVILALAELGVRMTGLDLSPWMLGAAAKKLRQRGLDARLIVGDMRSFEINASLFQAVIAPINTLLHLESTNELRNCLRSVRRHLSPGGVFAFDVFNPQVRRLSSNGDRQVLGRFRSGCGKDEILVEETVRYDAARQVLRGTLHFSKNGSGEFHAARMDLRCIFPQELPLLLEAAGFMLVERHGGFECEPFTDASPHQVCIAVPRG